MSVACCQVKVFASSRSLVQRSPNNCDGESSIMRKTWPTGWLLWHGKKNAPGRAAQYMPIDWVSSPLPLVLIVKNLTLN
jgi:hypothetical protein